MDLIELIHDASNLSSDIFIETLDKATTLLSDERGQTNNFTINNHLITLEQSGEELVIGDLHGNLDSLQVILKKSKIIDKLTTAKDSVLIFLGDYGDRGNKSAEVYFAVLQLKLAFPDQVCCCGETMKAKRPYGFSTRFAHPIPIRFEGNWRVAYQKTRALWSYLYNAVYVPERYLMVHGGVSPEIKTYKTSLKLNENQNEAVLEDLLWSDPDENVQGRCFVAEGCWESFLAKQLRRRFLGGWR